MTITMARRNWRKRLEAEARPSPHAPSPRHCMTPQEFLNKWRHVELTERSASQSHFNDLCALLGVLDPIAADPKGEWSAFEKGATKPPGGDGLADVCLKGSFAWESKNRTSVEKGTCV